MTTDMWEWEEAIDGTRKVGSTTDFWGCAIPEYAQTQYQDGRACSNCGAPLSDDARGNLCRTCRNRCKSNEVQSDVQRFLSYRRCKKVDRLADEIVERDIAYAVWWVLEGPR